MQDKPQTRVPETPTNSRCDLLCYIIHNHHAHSGQTFIQKVPPEVFEALEIFRDATSIYSAIEGNKVNRNSVSVPEQLLHKLAGPMVRKYTTCFLKNLGPDLTFSIEDGS